MERKYSIFNANIQCSIWDAEIDDLQLFQAKLLS